MIEKIQTKNEEASRMAKEKTNLKQLIFKEFFKNLSDPLEISKTASLAPGGDIKVKFCEAVLLISSGS